MTLTIELTPEQQAALEAEATSHGMDLPEFARRRLLENLPAQPTWGARIIEQWRQAGALGTYGDMNRDSLQVARELRAAIESGLFSKGVDES